MEELEEGQIVLCTVKTIVGTMVFVDIEGVGEATLTTSEIAPGRIRNLREYVVPGKKIVCKVLKIRENHIHLSLRRVKQHERKELLDKIEKEKSYKAVLKTVLGQEESEKVLIEITKEYSLVDFFEKIKSEPKIINQFLNKELGDKIIKILDSKKDKLKEIKQFFILSSKAENGIIKIKEIIKNSCNNSKCEISYIAAGKYRLEIKGEDFKKIRNEVNLIFENIEKQAKKQGCFFEVEK